MPHKTKEARNEYAKSYALKNREKVSLWRKNYLDRTPWSKAIRGARSRCAGKLHHYYKNGIKMLLTVKEAKYLWLRDKASELKKASLDRINSSGNYTFDNCRFIELEDNLKRRKACHKK